MAKKNRDEFSPATKDKIARLASLLCSDPSCRRLTVGSNSDGDGEINLGVAAHICAAAPGGPRYDPNMTREQRKSADNGIWLCQNHAKAVDSKDSAFTVEVLREWRTQAHEYSWRRVLYNDLPLDAVAQAPSIGDLTERLRAATIADLEVFHRSDKWPPTEVALTLEVDGLRDAVSTSALATALTTLDNLILVAHPGMGKTTTLFQIAEALLANGNASPIVIPLGDWSADGASLLESILKRPAFRDISEDDLRSVAEKPGVILLLDGWNELDSTAQKRAAMQVSRLQLELPELSLLISTREQALDVPVDGTRINLLPLDETQQINIARALRGESGERILDEAWRTPGVRDLVIIPLYCRVLLSLPDGAPLPATKEEELGSFVAAHEQDVLRAAALADVTHGFHQRFLEDLAAKATRGANTTLAETVARATVSQVLDALVSEGQITEKPQPNAVLEALVSHHVLTRSGDPAGYSFQHQQFQEWYASRFVECLILGSTDDETSREILMAEVFDHRSWEEATFFACERLARGTQQQQEACGEAILAAFVVDPILAAGMIYRATDSVWAHIGTSIQGLVGNWHAPGTVDRALRFMICSGRPEFLDQVWPLITHQDDQVHLAALRAGGTFRPSILGSDAAKRLASLPPKIRQNVLHEIAFNSDMDGLDLAATVAKADPDPEVKVAVVDAFAFRRADRHVAEVLQGADNPTFDLLARKDLIDNVTDETVKAGLAAARERLRKDGERPYDRLYSLIYGRGEGDPSAELVTVIAEMEIGDKREGAVNLIYEAKERFPKAVADGILRRVYEGRTLPYHAPELMAAAGFALEDEDLCRIALDAGRRDDRADAAASVLGAQSVGFLIESVFEVREQIWDADGRCDEAANDRYFTIFDRIKNTQISSLVGAITARSARCDSRELAVLADLISRHPNGENDRGQPFNAAAIGAIAGFVEDWGNRLLGSPDATRAELASIAALASHSPSARLLPMLRQLLDEELRRRGEFKEQARAENYQGGIATNEARTSWNTQYQRAFSAIGGSEAEELMREYLPNEEFGECAAQVLADQWRAMNEPYDRTHWRAGPDFSRVAERRAAITANPMTSSPQADAIFVSIERLIGKGATEDSERHALALAIVAAALPHGQRDDLINTLIDMADRYPRCKLLNNLALSGATVGLELIKQGIADTVEAGKEREWILTERKELQHWVRLLPFTDRLTEAVDVVRTLPEAHRSPTELEEMLDALGHLPGEDAENVLFQLAEAEPHLYAHHAWREVVIRRGTLTAATRFVDLATQGVFSRDGETNQFHMARRIAELIGEHTEVRGHVYELLERGPFSPGLALLAHAVAENPDADGLLLLIELEIRHRRSFAPWRTVQAVVTEHVPVENWQGAFNVVAAPVAELRRKLLAMTTDGGSNDIAARYLNLIDKIRDEYGAPDSEPRHPDLDSGKAWPIMAPDPDASETG